MKGAESQIESSEAHEKEEEEGPRRERETEREKRTEDKGETRKRNVRAFFQLQEIIALDARRVAWQMPRMPGETKAKGYFLPLYRRQCISR